MERKISQRLTALRGREDGVGKFYEKKSGSSARPRSWAVPQRDTLGYISVAEVWVWLQQVWRNCLPCDPWLPNSVKLCKIMAIHAVHVKVAAFGIYISDNSHNSYLYMCVWPVCPNGRSLLLSVCRDIWEGGDWTTTSDCEVCLLFITAPSSLFSRHLIRPDYRVIAI